MINPMNILNFVKSHFREIIKVGFGIFILYWMLYILTPSISMSKNEKQLIDSLNIQIKLLYEQQTKLDSSIAEYNKKIDNVDKDIDKIKGQKTIIKEIYHEEINRAGNYTEPELDSFFSTRYHN